jgi:hypothetical protein
LWIQIFLFHAWELREFLCSTEQVSIGHEDMPPNGDNSQHKKIKHHDAAPNSNTSLQSSIPLKPASLPGLIMVNKLSAVIRQQTSLLTNSGINNDMNLTQISDPSFCHIISQCIKLQVFHRCKFYNKEHHGTYN